MHVRDEWKKRKCGWREWTLLPAVVGLLRPSSSVKSQRSKASFHFTLATVNTCLWPALVWTYASVQSKDWFVSLDKIAVTVTDIFLHSFKQFHNKPPDVWIYSQLIFGFAFKLVINSEEIVNLSIAHQDYDYVAAAIRTCTSHSKFLYHKSVWTMFPFECLHWYWGNWFIQSHTWKCMLQTGVDGLI